jgi:hypothetical protein
MKTETVKLSQVSTNAANPRQIKDSKFVKLVNSILIFPKMLAIRPIVVDNTMTALGGNMRCRALSFIAEMSEDDVLERLQEARQFDEKTDTEKSNLIEYWKRWLENPTAIIIKASELSDAEKKEFIIKDNVGFGEWDYDILANDWDMEELKDWGVEVWQENIYNNVGEITDIDKPDVPETKIVVSFSIEQNYDKNEIIEHIRRALDGYNVIVK